MSVERSYILRLSVHTADISSRKRKARVVSRAERSYQRPWWAVYTPSRTPAPAVTLQVFRSGLMMQIA